MIKRCSKCKLDKENKEFPKNKGAKSGIGYWCLECCRKNNKRVYRKNSKYYIQKSNLKQIEKHYEDQKRWARNNFEKRKYITIKHRGKISNIEVDTRENFLNWYNSQLKNCYYCEITEKELIDKKIRGNVGKNLSVDRLDPLKGYLIDNMVLACAICNSIKSDILSSKEMKEIAIKYDIKNKIINLKQYDKSKNIK